MAKLKAEETTTPYNPFSDILNNLIEGAYSKDITKAEESFNSLISYFKKGRAKKSEVEFITMSNNHSIVELIYSLEGGDKELLCQTVGQVIRNHLSPFLGYTLDEEEAPELIGCSDEEAPGLTDGI